MPTSDGYEWVALIEAGRARDLLPAYHALPMYTVHGVRQLAAAAGLPLPALPLIQGVNAALAGAGAALMAATIGVIGGGVALQVLGGALLAVSLAFWYFANGELHHFSLVIQQAIFFLVVRARARGTGPSPAGLIGLGALNALAVMCHQESFIFGFAVVALVMAGRPLGAGLRDAIVYTVAGSVATGVLAVVIGLGLAGLESGDELVRWFFWIVYAAHDPHPYRLDNALGAVLRMAKGQLTALTVGVQVAADAARDTALLRERRVLVLAGLGIATCLVALALLVDLFRRRRALPPPVAVAAAGCLAWIGAYKLLLHWWFWPTAPEYHMVTLPPLVLLLLLGSIARPTAPAAWTIGPALLLVAMVGAADFAGTIQPWARYARMKEALAAHVSAAVGPEDLVVSAESGIDPVFERAARTLRLKETFSGAPADAAFARVASAIDDRLRAGRRVFVYNLVPAPYTLIGIGHAAAARGERAPTAEEFASFQRGLRERYALVPFAAYWEESREPLYLYGRRWERIWEVTRRAP